MRAKQKEIATSQKELRMTYLRPEWVLLQSLRPRLALAGHTRPQRCLLQSITQLSGKALWKDHDFVLCPRRG